PGHHIPVGSSHCQAGDGTIPKTLWKIDYETRRNPLPLQHRFYTVMTTLTHGPPYDDEWQAGWVVSSGQHRRADDREPTASLDCGVRGAGMAYRRGIRR